MQSTTCTLIQVYTQHLLVLYGPVIEYDGLAEILHTTVAALRIRKSRRNDLPPHLPGLSKRCWAVPTVVEWLLLQRADDSLSPVAAIPSRRGPGRPRKSSNLTED